MSKDYPEMQIDYAEGTWKIIECDGSEQVSFCEIWINSEDINYETRMPEEHVIFYPERRNNFSDYQHFEVLPSKVRELYLEAI